MKKVVILMLICFSTISFAQPIEKEKRNRKDQKEFFESLSDEELATLKSKKMMLSLDLSPQQYQQVYTLTLNKVKTKRNERMSKKKPSELSNEEKFTLANERLDDQITHKKEMKSILNETQYEKWERIAARSTMRHKRSHKRTR
ncbi:MAG: hypothetical protein ACWA5P_12875 [bacterium]